MMFKMAFFGGAPDLSSGLDIEKTTYRKISDNMVVRGQNLAILEGSMNSDRDLKEQDSSEFIQQKELKLVFTVF
jgi:hypothetical protein